MGGKPAVLAKLLRAGCYCLLTAALMVAGCAPAAPERAAAPASSQISSRTTAFPVTVTGDDGRSATFTQAPARIVSLSPGHTEILYAIGAGGLLAGVDDFSDYPAEAQRLPKLSYSQVNLEQLVGLRPDLVITVTRQKAAVPEMEKLGLKVFYLTEAGTIEGILDRIETLGKITNREEAARQLASQMRGRIEAVTARAGTGQPGNGPSVFYELSPQYHTAGDSSFIGDILKKLNVRNIASGIDSPFPQLNVEQIIAADPEMIILADPEAGVTRDSVRGRAGWDKLSAVRNNRIIIVENRDIIHRPGPRVVEGIEFLAKALYPDRFR